MPGRVNADTRVTSEKVVMYISPVGYSKLTEFNMSLEALNFFNDHRVASGRASQWFVSHNAAAKMVVLAIPTPDFFLLIEAGYDSSEFENGFTPMESSELRPTDRDCWNCKGLGFKCHSGEWYSGMSYGAGYREGPFKADCGYCSGGGKEMSWCELETPRVAEGFEDRKHFPFQYLALPCIDVDCDTCDGKGTHVNPSIDCGGISSDDFDRDPGFREEYFNGTYDVTCYACKGAKTSPQIDIENLSPDNRKSYDVWAKLQAEEAAEQAYADAERAAEMRMGC